MVSTTSCQKITPFTIDKRQKIKDKKEKEKRVCGKGEIFVISCLVIHFIAINTATS